MFTHLKLKAPDRHTPTPTHTHQLGCSFSVFTHLKLKAQNYDSNFYCVVYIHTILNISLPASCCMQIRDTPQAESSSAHYLMYLLFHPGLSFFYALLVLELLWLFHIMIIFWRLKFPHHARQIRTRGHLKYVHIGMVFAAITLPWVCLGTILGTGGLTMTRFPPGYCLAQDFNAAFYTFVLPISIINALGASLITLILWTIITTRMTFKELQRKVSQWLCSIFFANRHNTYAYLLYTR